MCVVRREKGMKQREIKFRAWDRKDKRFVDFGPLYGLKTHTEKSVDDGNFYISQFTGLKDKNGKEIYEGDIVHLGGNGTINGDGNWWGASGGAGYNSPIQKVEWIDEYAGFFPFANYDSDCGVEYDPEKMEVIGNVYENPELLTP